MFQMRLLSSSPKHQKSLSQSGSSSFNLTSNREDNISHSIESNEENDVIMKLMTDLECMKKNYTMEEEKVVELEEQLIIYSKLKKKRIFVNLLILIFNFLINYFSSRKSSTSR